MQPGELRTSIRISWLIVTALTLPVIAAPFVLPAGTVFALAPKCEWKAKYGRECVLCGMTTAFVLIAQGNPDSATKANRGSIPLFAAFVANQFLGFSFTVRMLRSGPRRFRWRRLCKL